MNDFYLRECRILFLYNHIKMNRQFLTPEQQNEMHWRWTPTQATIKKLINPQNNITENWSLSPSISLTSPSEVGLDPSVRLFIDTETSMNYSKRMGWQWHKTWSIPNISVRMEITNQHSGKALMTPKNIFCQICCVLRDKSQTDINKEQLRQIDLKGKNILPMIDGQAYYSGLKFSISSQSLFGQYFHLIAIIYIKQNNEKPKVLTAVISPGIFVISKTQIFQTNSEHIATFAHLANIPSKETQQTGIKNGLQQMVIHLENNTLWKHPLCLAMFFSSCIQILYCQENISKKRQKAQNLNTHELIIYFQKIFLDENNGFLSQIKKEKRTLNDYEEMCFLVCLNDDSDVQKKNKIMEILSHIQSESIGLVCKGKNQEIHSQLKNKFKSIPSQQLTHQYANVYNDLQQLFKSKLQEQISEENSLIDPPITMKGDHIKIQKMNNGRGYTYQAISKQKKKNNQRKKGIICHTIETYDRKPAEPQMKTRRSSRINKKNEETVRDIPKIQQYSPQNIIQQQDNIRNDRIDPQIKQSAFSNFKASQKIEQPIQFTNPNIMNNLNNLNSLANYQGSNLDILSSGLNPSSLFNPSINYNQPISNNFGINPLQLLNLNYSAYNLNPAGNINPLLSGLGLPNNSLQLNPQQIIPDKRILQNSVNTLMCNNLLLNNWLHSVKQNNQSLYDEAKKLQTDVPFADPSTIDNKYELDDNLNEQGLKYLNQQINLHKQLLNQIIYQNQLLSQSIGIYLNQNDSGNNNGNLTQQNNAQNQDDIITKKRKL